MRTGAEIEEALKALEAFEDANPQCQAEISLQTDGEGSIIITDKLARPVEGIDFMEGFPLMKAVEAVVERLKQSA